MHVIMYVIYYHDSKNFEGEDQSYQVCYISHDHSAILSSYIELCMGRISNTVPNCIIQVAPDCII